ncbi:MAG: hypothetical protein LiPW15_407 [Parcubacteria group bacterium LiPW_15]|nr:MAG: hypothetical protein LiPW15_407 [Parcubacteria group bacterium LiPW_15]
MTRPVRIHDVFVLLHISQTGSFVLLHDEAECFVPKAKTANGDGWARALEEAIDYVSNEKGLNIISVFAKGNREWGIVAT